MNTLEEEAEIEWSWVLSTSAGKRAVGVRQLRENADGERGWHVELVHHTFYSDSKMYHERL